MTLEGVRFLFISCSSECGIVAERCSVSSEGKECNVHQKMCVMEELTSRCPLLCCLLFTCFCGLTVMRNSTTEAVMAVLFIEVVWMEIGVEGGLKPGGGFFLYLAVDTFKC